MRLMSPLLAMAAALMAPLPGRNRRHESRPLSRRATRMGHGTEPHPVRDAQRQRRAYNAVRNFETGHWQYANGTR